MDAVHSRLGLAFTGLVELLVSTITSVSVCALVGFRVTMVPWLVDLRRFTISDQRMILIYLVGSCSRWWSFLSALRICSISYAQPP